MTGYLLAALAFALGGIIKGATGAGAPLIAVPVISMFFNVPTAIAVFAIPNLVSNMWQAASYRRFVEDPLFVAYFALAGAAGVGLGTMLLSRLPGNTLLMLVALAILAYIGFRLLRPDWRLPESTAFRLAVPVGILAGTLQGATGVSAPVSITFVNAQRKRREWFIATISVFFLAMGVVQVPMLAYYGFLTMERVWLGFAALGVLLAFMPVGAWLARFISRENFDRLILVLLAAIALRLVVQAWPG